MSSKQRDDCSSQWNQLEEAGVGNNTSHGNTEKNPINNTDNPGSDYCSNSIKRFRQGIVAVASSRFIHPPSMETTFRMNNLLREVFSVNQTLNHPPYQKMICKAIKDLNEECGSNEARISSYIKKRYEHDVLPWGHESLLAHHLRQLVSGGNVFIDPNGCYKLFPFLVKAKGESSASSRRERPPKKEKREKKKVVYYGPKRKRGRPRKTNVENMSGKEAAEEAASCAMEGSSWPKTIHEIMSNAKLNVPQN